MFGPSLKSVPGCLVSMVPMLIGVPVALTPGFGPHDDVPLELAAVLAAVVALDAALELLELLLLLPQAASSSAPMSAASATLARTRGAWWLSLTLVLLLEVIPSTRPGWRGDDLIVKHFCMQERPREA
ncbi:MAG: hypothetical protein WCD11_03880 [Solirubrobacteraceae bacterium]